MEQPPARKNYITPAGMTRLREEYDQLFHIERPKMVEVVSWAAGNGDRSENGDYLYGRKRLREIDRRLNQLSGKMKAAVVIDPAQQPQQDRVFFGAQVTYVDEEDREHTVTLVGQDEADAGQGRVSWFAPIARALRGARVGDAVTVQTPHGPQELEVLAIRYGAALPDSHRPQ